mmetsp:Transcript_40426/g.97583  ORF Transcript_40426/g.97583 Transcript_40426/m.97583 type:complete len:326 (+) Transcript_40426:130-1107(+)
MTTNNANAKPAANPSFSSFKASFDKVEDSTFETIDCLFADEASAQTALTKLQPAVENIQWMLDAILKVMDTCDMDEDELVEALVEAAQSFFGGDPTAGFPIECLDPADHMEGFKGLVTRTQTAIVGAEKFLSRKQPSFKDALKALLEATESDIERIRGILLALAKEKEQARAEKAAANTKPVDDDSSKKEDGGDDHINPADINASSPIKKRSAEESAVDGQRSPKRLSSNRKETSTQQDGEENKEEEEKHSVADPAAAAAVEEHLVAAVAAPVKKTVAAKDPEEDTGDAKGTAAPVTKDAAAVAENLRIAPSMITSNKAMHQIDA